MSYNPALPTLRDELRLKLADTSGDPSKELFPDSTYDAMLGKFTFNEATAQLAEGLAAKYFQMADAVTEEDEKREFRNRAKGMLLVADAARQKDQAPPPETARFGVASGRMAAPDLTNYRTD